MFATVRPFARLLLFTFVALSLGGESAYGDDLDHMSIEELISVDVTSVSKKKEKAVDAAAALYVLTAEDIRRSGAKTIPDALRMVPGVTVAQYNSYSWSVSMRGFATILNNKLLVLIDGRSIYGPIFGGVSWEFKDTELEHIERIEVIRGPGATMWGANAVNGVINIITKSAWDTQQTSITAGGGLHEEGFASATHGGMLSEDTAYRSFVKGFSRGAYDRADTGATARDSWWGLRAGGRTDSDLGLNDTLTISSEVYHQEQNQFYNFGPITSANFPEEDRDDTEHNGAFLLTNWKRALQDNADIEVAGYYEYESQEGGLVGVDLHTINVDAQHRFTPFENHEIVWGAGFRQHFDDIDGTYVIDFDPESRDYHLANVFIQNEYDVIKDTLSIVLGTKVEDSTFSDVELQPNVRVAWHPVSQTTVWGAVSRAVRIPSRGEEDAQFVYSELVEFESQGMETPPLLVSADGNSSVEAEKLIAYEVGVRRQFSENFFADITAYYNDYNNIVSFESEFDLQTTPSPLLLINSTADNQLKAEAHGVEVTGEWRPQDNWRLVLWYNYAQQDFSGSNTTDNLDPGGVPVISSTETGTPEYQAGIRSLLNVTETVDLDGILRFVDKDRNPFRRIPARYDLDLRAAWRPVPGLELSVVGRNLIKKEQFEWNEAIFDRPPVDIERTVYAQVRWEF